MKEEEMTPELVERVNMNNNQMEESNMALGPSTEDNLRRLNISVGNNAELRSDVEQLSNGIVELEVIEVEDLIETIHAIDDKKLKTKLLMKSARVRRLSEEDKLEEVRRLREEYLREVIIVIRDREKLTIRLV